MMKYKHKRMSSGWTLLELTISIVIIAMLMIAMSYATSAAGKTNNIQHHRQRAIAAAQSQLDCFSACGCGLSDETIDRLWGDVQIETVITEATGNWQGMSLVSITANCKYGQMDIKVTRRRYIDDIQDAEIVPVKQNEIIIEEVIPAADPNSINRILSVKEGASDENQ